MAPCSGNCRGPTRQCENVYGSSRPTYLLLQLRYRQDTIDSSGITSLHNESHVKWRLERYVALVRNENNEVIPKCVEELVHCPCLASRASSARAVNWCSIHRKRWISLCTLWSSQEWWRRSHESRPCSTPPENRGVRHKVSKRKTQNLICKNALWQVRRAVSTGNLCRIFLARKLWPTLEHYFARVRLQCVLIIQV